MAAVCSSLLKRLPVRPSGLSIFWMFHIQQSVWFLHLSLSLSVWQTGRLPYLIFPPLFCLVVLPDLSIYSVLSHPGCQTSDLSVPLTLLCLWFLCSSQLFLHWYFLLISKKKAKMSKLNTNWECSPTSDRNQYQIIYQCRTHHFFQKWWNNELVILGQREQTYWLYFLVWISCVRSDCLWPLTSHLWSRYMLTTGGKTD